MARSYLTRVAGASVYRRYGGHVAIGIKVDTVAGLARGPSLTKRDGPMPCRVARNPGAERYRNVRGRGRAGTRNTMEEPRNKAELGGKNVG